MKWEFILGHDVKKRLHMHVFALKLQSIAVLIVKSKGVFWETTADYDVYFLSSNCVALLHDHFIYPIKSIDISIRRKMVRNKKLLKHYRNFDKMYTS